MSLRRLTLTLSLLACGAGPLPAQSGAAACGLKPVSTAHQFIKVYRDLRVCILAMRADTSSLAGPREWNGTGSPVILETQRDGEFRRMMIAGDTLAWTINGQPGPADSAAVAWRAAVVDLLDAAREADDLRATARDLGTDIDSMPVRRKRLESEIADLDRLVNNMRAEMRNLRERDGSLASNITSLEGRIRSLESQANGQRSAAGSSDASTRARAEANLRRLEDEARNLDGPLRRLERDRMNLDAERKIGAIEVDLQSLRPDHTLTMMRLRLGEMTPESTAAAKQQLAHLDAESRLRVLDGRVQKALAGLRATLPPTQDQAVSGR